MSDDDADSSKEEGERVHDFSSVESEREGSSSTEEVDADEDDEDENVTAADSNLPFNVVLIIYLIQRIKREVVYLPTSGNMNPKGLYLKSLLKELLNTLDN